MLFENITIIDENLEVKRHMYVGTEGDKIAYIGSTKPDCDYGRVYRGEKRLLMSGLINTHTHTPMTLLRGYGENMKLSDWLFKKIFPFEAKMTREDVYGAALLGIAEMMRTGTVSATEMYFHSDEIIRAALESGFKMNISNGITSFDGNPLFENKNFIEEKRNLEEYHGADSGRILADFSIHAEYTTNPEIVRALAEYCTGKNVRIHVHVSETKDEVEECKARHNGLTPPQYFASLGLFDTPVVAAHCVHLEGDDFALLARKGVSIAHCPISNLKLASGIMDAKKVIDKGINLTIGTDGCASNNNVDLFEDVKLFALLHKGTQLDPTFITPAQALGCVTKNAAKAQGREDCGRLMVGNRADLIVADMGSPNMFPAHDPLNNVIYSMKGADVVLTMIDGRVVYKDGEFKTIDIEKIFFEVEKSCGRILSELHMKLK